MYTVILYVLLGRGPLRMYTQSVAFMLKPSHTNVYISTFQGFKIFQGRYFLKIKQALFNQILYSF